MYSYNTGANIALPFFKRKQPNFQAYICPNRAYVRIQFRGVLNVGFGNDNAINFAIIPNKPTPKIPLPFPPKKSHIATLNNQQLFTPCYRCYYPRATLNSPCSHALSNGKKGPQEFLDSYIEITIVKAQTGLYPRKTGVRATPTGPPSEIHRTRISDTQWPYTQPSTKT